MGPKYRWRRKSGKQYFKLNGKLTAIKAGEVMEAYEHEITSPKMWDCLGPIGEEDTKLKLPTGAPAPSDRIPTLAAVHKGQGNWVVLNAEGVQINEGFLKKKDALELVERGVAVEDESNDDNTEGDEDPE